MFPSILRHIPNHCKLHEVTTELVQVSRRCGSGRSKQDWPDAFDEGGQQEQYGRGAGLKRMTNLSESRQRSCSKKHHIFCWVEKQLDYGCCNSIFLGVAPRCGNCWTWRWTWMQRHRRRKRHWWKRWRRNTWNWQIPCWALEDLEAAGNLSGTKFWSHWSRSFFFDGVPLRNAGADASIADSKGKTVLLLAPHCPFQTCHDGKFRDSMVSIWD